MTVNVLVVGRLPSAILCRIACHEGCSELEGNVLEMCLIELLFWTTCRRDLLNTTSDSYLAPLTRHTSAVATVCQPYVCHLDLLPMHGLPL